jgi:hypothetical protein
MGLRLLAALVASLVLAAPARADIEEGVTYLWNVQRESGGFGEAGSPADGSLTAWAVLGFRSVDRWPRSKVAEFLADQPIRDLTDLELRLLANDALGRNVDWHANRIEDARVASGRIGPTVSSTIWGMIALRAAGRPVGSKTVRYLLDRQRPSGGWSWYAGGAADSNDTAAAIQALRAGGVPGGSGALDRAVRFLRRLQNADGGFELSSGRGSDSQSTAWAVQALVAAKRPVGGAAFGYLHRRQRANGCFAYSRGRVVTPVWVTSQVLPALARRPFPLP